MDGAWVIVEWPFELTCVCSSPLPAHKTRILLGCVCVCEIVGLIPNVDDEMGGRLPSVSTLDREHGCETN